MNLSFSIPYSWNNSSAIKSTRRPWKVVFENYSWVADEVSKKKIEKWNVKEKIWLFVWANNEWLNANKASWWTYFALLRRICMKKLFFSSSSLSHLMFIIYLYFFFVYFFFFHFHFPSFLCTGLGFWISSFFFVRMFMYRSKCHNMTSND